MSNAVVRGNERREQILAMAMEMFGEVGYRGTSLRDIATRVGITHPGLLYHFHSKEELLQAVLQRRDERDRTYFKLLETSDPVKQIEGMLANIAANVNTPGMIELFATLAAESADPQHPAHAYFKERYVMLNKGIEEVLANLEKAGELNRKVNKEKLAEEFTAVIEGLQIQWLYFPDQIDMVAQLRDRVNEILAHPIDESIDFYALAREYTRAADAATD